MHNDPLPPDVLADALQDKVHRDVGNVRPAKAVRLTPAMEEAREIMAGLRAINEHFGYQWTQPLMRAEQDVAAALAKRDGEVAAEREKREAVERGSESILRSQRTWQEAAERWKQRAEEAERRLDAATMMAANSWRLYEGQRERADAAEARLAKMERVVEAARLAHDYGGRVAMAALGQALADLDTPS